MIRYPVSKADIEQQAGQYWLDRAAEKTKTFKQLGRYEEKSAIWSEVKPIYMKLQGNGKCIFCEREMEAVANGKVEQDLEHFRPKGNVKAWKPSKALTDAGVKVTAVPATGTGYYLLPYHLLNYAAACKPCNSTLKKDYFPIAGKYNLKGSDPAKMKSEKPLLIYPVGDLDSDPELLITFTGASPVAVSKSGHKRHRALVTIEFFKLDDPEKRKNLYRDRALLIIALYSLLQKTKVGTAAQKAAARATVDNFLQPGLRHLNCARSFDRLYAKDSSEAEAVFDSAVKLMTSIS
jgi:hypothetical protein